MHYHFFSYVANKILCHIFKLSALLKCFRLSMRIIHHHEVNLIYWDFARDMLQKSMPRSTF